MTSFHHQPEAQHPKSSVIHKPPADYPIYWRVISTDGRNTLSWLQEMGCLVISQRFHRGFTAAEKTELWDRWQRGESLKAIGRAFLRRGVARDWH